MNRHKEILVEERIPISIADLLYRLRPKVLPKDISEEEFDKIVTEGLISLSDESKRIVREWLKKSENLILFKKLARQRTE